jgi:type II secretory pathway component PulC
MRLSVFVPLFALAASGCGGAVTTVAEPQGAPTKSIDQQPPPEPPEPQPKESVSRASVDATLKAGLGKFLSQVEVEPHLNRGEFIGWRIVELRGAMWEGVDLKPGDIVTRVNGFKIEREYEANAAFKSLAVASEIRVSIVRNGQPTEIRFSIVE